MGGALAGRSGAQNALHAGHQLLSIEGFSEVPGSAEVACLVLGGFTLASGDEDHRKTLAPGLQRFEQLETGHAGHAHVGNKTRGRVKRAARQIIFGTSICPSAVTH